MKNKAFTLIETLIGITMMTLVLTAVTGLILNTIISNQRNLHSLQATAYAQEGIEIMRFIRDSNWLQNYSWDGGKAIWGADFNLDEKDPITFYLKEDDCPPCWTFSTDEEDGIIENEKGFEFLRTVELSSVLNKDDETMKLDDTAEVTVILEWVDRSVERSLELSTYLTNWQ